MTTVSLSNNVIQTDKRLARRVSAALEELAQHRWHWTLDESNPRRVSLSAYAKSVGVTMDAVSRHARGYAAWIANGKAGALVDEVERARLSRENRTAVEAVAKANNVSLSRARIAYVADAKRVREAVARKAEKEPDADPAEYAEQVAKIIVGTRQAEQESRERRKASKSHAYNELSGLLAKARRAVNDCIEVARDTELEDETKEFVVDALGKLEASVSLLRLAVTDASDIDWDAEMIKMGGDLS